MEYEQTCVDDVCKCNEGLRGVEDGNDDDRKAMYPGISQCRNGSLPTGRGIFILKLSIRIVY